MGLDRRTKTVISSVLLIGMTGCAGIPGSDLFGDADGSPSSGTTGANASPAESPNHPVVTDAEGIIIAFESDGACTVLAVNPDNGATDTLATIPAAPDADATYCNESAARFPFAFSSDFDKLTVNTAVLTGGFIDVNGYKQVGPSPDSPDFGDRVISTRPRGFDKHDNFYYSVETGPLDVSQPLTTFYRVPAGSTEGGESIGVATDSTFFGYMPDGTLSPDAAPPANVDLAMTPCAGEDFPYDGFFDPNRTKPYYYGHNGALYEDLGYCQLGGNFSEEPEPVSRKGNFSINSIASNPEGTKMAVQGDWDKLYIADLTSSGGTPAKLDVPELDGITTWVIKEWR